MKFSLFSFSHLVKKALASLSAITNSFYQLTRSISWAIDPSPQHLSDVVIHGHRFPHSTILSYGKSVDSVSVV